MSIAQLIGVTGVSEVRAAVSDRLEAASVSTAQRSEGEQLAALVEIGRDLTSTLDLPEVLRRVVRDARRLVHAKLTSLMLARAGGFETVATDGAGPAYTARARPGVHQSVSGRALLSGVAVVVEDVLADPDFQHVEVALAEGLRSLLSVPLRTKDRIIGVLNVYSGERRSFAADEVALLTLLAQQAAVAIENAELFRAAREAGEGLRASEKLAALGRLSAGLAHELRNPLNTLSVLSYAMLSQAGEGPWRADLEVVESEIRRMSLLVDQFLDFARPRPPRSHRHRLDEILEETLLLVGPEASKRKIRVDRAFAPDTPSVWADGDQLKQVFLNLCLNAIQAMEGGGQLRLTLGRASGGVVVEVRDSGPGIPEADRERLFEPFFTTREGGTGLGLPVSLRIVEGHSGTLAIESAPGGGAMAIVWLPV